MTLQTQVEVKGFYTGAIGCGNLRTTCTILTQYCRGTEQIFTLKGSFDIANKSLLLAPISVWQETGCIGLLRLAPIIF